MNAGIYREGGGAGGLPLPRKNLQALTVAIGVIAFLAVILGPSLLVLAPGYGSGMAKVWRMLNKGALYTFPVVLMGLGIPVVLAVLGAFVVRGIGNLSFPLPEGGIVTVVYPILFAPGG